jgi:hypothetical protein
MGLDLDDGAKGSYYFVVVGTVAVKKMQRNLVIK